MSLCSSLYVFQREENVHLASEHELVQYNARLSRNVDLWAEVWGSFALFAWSDEL